MTSETKDDDRKSQKTESQRAYRAKKKAQYQAMVERAARARAAKADMLRRGIPLGKRRSNLPPQPGQGQHLSFAPSPDQIETVAIPLNGHRHPDRALPIPKRQPRIIDLETEETDIQVSEEERFASFVVACWRQLRKQR